MATRKPEPPPPPEADPERRDAALSDLRLWVAVRLTDDDERMAWMLAWRRWDDALGPCPITEGELRRAVAAYPDRSGYPPTLAAWQEDRGPSRQP